MSFLKPDGHLAYICPHKFFNAQYGMPLRGLIATGNHLRHVVHFGDEQVFAGATIYTCLLFLAQGGSPECRFMKASDLDSWKKSLVGVEGRFHSRAISSSEWNFTVGKERNTFERLAQHERRLGDIARIWQGVVTSADRLYVLREIDGKGGDIIEAEGRDGRRWKLEAECARPLIMDVPICRFGIHRPTHRIIVPYRLEGSSQVLLSPKELKTRVPKVWAYLGAQEEELRSRESGKADDDSWYRYLYPKNLALFDSEKLIVQVMSREPRFAFDGARVFFTGGGNGPYYGLRLSDSRDQAGLLAVQGILNSKVTAFFMSKTSTTFRGGYWSFGKQFIERIPIPCSSASADATLSHLVRLLLFVTCRLESPLEVESTRDPLMLAYWEQILNGLVYELYFPDQVRGAGLRLFDLVQQTGLPDIESIAESQRLPILREKFEDLYDGDHPLRIALDKLQMLDTVRIIEGKT